MSKDKIISFKVEEKTFEAFSQLCEDTFESKSQKLYRFVHEELKQASKNSKTTKV